ncbi:MAG: alginate export family protein [Bacteroidetes bacterium]|nr:alginate export family protein [Bacteroidota bacterium]
MKKTLTLLTVIAVQLTSINIVNAQFTLSGEFRPRTEYTHGYKALPNLDQEPGFFTSQRSRVNLKQVTSNYTFYLCLQDVRTWGSQPQLVTNDGALTTFHEAWGMAHLNKNWKLKLGRQEINLDDQRIFGAVGWAQQARSHDAALFNYQNDSATFKAQIGLAYNQPMPQFNTNIYNVAKSYKTFQYVWLHKNWNNFNASLLALNIGQDAIKAKSHNTVFNQTLGGRLVYKKGKSQVAAALYHQMGLTGDTLNTKLSAQLASIDYGLQVNKKLGIGAGYEYISGQSQTSTDANYYSTQRAFNPYFGTNHKFNGFMDYFYVGNHIGSVGLQDVNVKAKMKNNGWTFGLAAHYFMAANEVLNLEKFNADGSIESLDNYLGTEIDFSVGTTISKTVKVNFLYAQMLGSETLETVKLGGDKDAFSNYAYIEFIFKPTFLTQ